ncbi:hypothetical protein [Dysgonomonas sp. 520]|uniref:hypothetical protein n=1 Tax=Dysgonomonas sp. 520 TaxID=2302931 RepID=UPI0013D08FAB|nr:hypothetical protein [Dysgonomonas sp. 520]NDW10991.1 hypothetical protein [Dysgonomonas sp. 520]
MIRVKSKVRVVSSEELSAIRLDKMVGMVGRVIEDLTFDKRKNKGYIVHFPKAYLGEKDWFIPQESIEHEE